MADRAFRAVLLADGTDGSATQLFRCAADPDLLLIASRASRKEGFREVQFRASAYELPADSDAIVLLGAGLDALEQAKAEAR